MNKNPLFIEYYPHTKSDCYKIRVPWTRYREHVIVLCEVSEGLEKAKMAAARELRGELMDALNQPLANPEISQPRGQRPDSDGPRDNP